MPKSKIKVIIAFAALYLIWGSTYLAILFAIRSIPPLLMAGARFIFAGVILYAGARLTGAKPSRRAWMAHCSYCRSVSASGGNGGVTLADNMFHQGSPHCLSPPFPFTSRC